MIKPKLVREILNFLVFAVVFPLGIGLWLGLGAGLAAIAVGVALARISE